MATTNLDHGQHCSTRTSIRWHRCTKTRRPLGQLPRNEVLVPEVKFGRNIARGGGGRVCAVCALGSNKQEKPAPVPRPFPVVDTAGACPHRPRWEASRGDARRVPVSGLVPRWHVARVLDGCWQGQKKGETDAAVERLVKDVADPEGICCTSETLRCKTHGGVGLP